MESENLTMPSSWVSRKPSKQNVKRYLVDLLARFSRSLTSASSQASTAMPALAVVVPHSVIIVNIRRPMTDVKEM
jgi:hypothetical protein